MDASWSLLLVTAVLQISLGLSTAPKFCSALRPLEAHLNFSHRLQYLKHNFPISYTVPVHYEEVFRVTNVTRLLLHKGVTEASLQELWLYINKEVLKKILQVLPQKHPSWSYVQQLEHLLGLVEQLFPQPKEDEWPEKIYQIYTNVMDPYPAAWKKVTPKALLDNCLRVMEKLFPCINRKRKRKQSTDLSAW
ncbi:interleukin-34 isoform X1 [Polypterus senegalus]|uniref:interleukin-34 isoform X1 n=2 Tax=Polypterus senegalus TaxID=55291 RepID=UPI0019639140|nr:interleukin-34 isoform X1 [Polypterus senegalus]XP_039618783.1 interleukin-34 isoform X1 [Polypterus senegalus]XP_039618784.1 interleukin-34 isoform X1 [Polypterus senegalus]XP_039618785.1 interleukin-34 isoform X1 [Polypterus senegalus]XP_039618786.1 interleukin-34 isoform X1 [Polypterus senegalus]